MNKQEAIEMAISEGIFVDDRYVREALDYLYSTARREALEEAAKAIRKNCEVCGGSGYDSDGTSDQFVTHDMALDACEPSMEGMRIPGREPSECPYCGKPIAVILQLKEKP